jgi:hypothetical protein
MNPFRLHPFRAPEFQGQSSIASPGLLALPLRRFENSRKPVMGRLNKEVRRFRITSHETTIGDFRETRKGGCRDQLQEPRPSRRGSGERSRNDPNDVQTAASWLSSSGPAPG